jgi:ribosomal protein S18 acetylase RimI-like enzyme
MTIFKMTAYPKQIELSDKSTISIRPMGSDDEVALLDFFLHIPEDERYYLKEDVTSPDVIRQWAEHLNYSRALPLLAFVGDRIVADGTLHRRRAGATKHRGEIRVVVDPEFRNKGIGTELMRELIEIARDSDLERITIELVAQEQESALQTAEALGFVRLATIPNYYRDVNGKPHDKLMMELPLGKWQDWWEF